MILYITEQGAGVYRRGERLQVRKGKDVLASVRLMEIEQVILFGGIGLSTPVMNCLLARGIDTIFLSTGGQYKGRLVGPAKGNILLRQTQFQRYAEGPFRLHMARAIVEGKLRNMRTLVLRWGRRRQVDVSNVAHRIRALMRSLPSTQEADVIRGIEGAATAAYFSVFGQFLPSELGFKNRNRRPPKDPANALLSFGYALLANSIEGAIYTVGMDPYVGFLHVVDYGRPSLVLDMMEEFRPILVDALVLDLAGHKRLTPALFERRDNGVFLGPEGRRLLIDALQQRLEERISYTVGKGRVENITYQRCMEYQIRQLARAIMDPATQYQSFVVR